MENVCACVCVCVSVCLSVCLSVCVCVCVCAQTWERRSVFCTPTSAYTNVCVRESDRQSDTHTHAKSLRLSRTHGHASTHTHARTHTYAHVPDHGTPPWGTPSVADCEQECDSCALRLQLQRRPQQRTVPRPAVQGGKDCMCVRVCVAFTRSLTLSLCVRVSLSLPPSLSLSPPLHLSLSLCVCVCVSCGLRART